ncbi:MAG: SEC-C domain-containing protein [Pseudomonadales bacterium]|nr:SEC-C domain-containing protein [Pseudomonadales bacterium]
MSRYLHKDLPLKKAALNKTPFETKKSTRIGSKRLPAKLLVQSQERQRELELVCADNNWACEIDIDADQDENILDLEFLQNKKPTQVSEKTPSRNDPCLCGSGKKYKKCCSL